MRKLYVYVAGPMAKGDTIQNIRKGIEQCEELSKNGFVPFNPFVDNQWHFLYPKSLDEWLEYDFAWILKCDAVFAMPGESIGRDKEIEFANQNKIPVFWCLRAISEWREKQIEEEKARFERLKMAVMNMSVNLNGRCMRPYPTNTDINCVLAVGHTGQHTNQTVHTKKDDPIYIW